MIISIVDDAQQSRTIADYLIANRDKLPWATGAEFVPVPASSAQSAEVCANELHDNMPSAVIIGAHCCFGDHRFRSALQGFRLAELLRMDSAFESPVLILSWLDRDSLLTKADTMVLARACTDADAGLNAHTVLMALPTALEDIGSEMERLINSFDTSNLAQLAVSLLENEMERVCHGIRHKHRNVTSCLRLLLGALCAGDIDETSFLKATRDLSLSDPDFGPVLQLSRKLIAARRHAGTVGSPAAPSRLPLSGKMLIIDDHYNTFAHSSEAKGDAGWKSVYEALMSNSKRFNFEVSGADSFTEALGLLEKELQQIDLIILDVDLGNPNESGLHLLHRIRCRDPFVPVVTVTAFDDAEVCEWALELQADAFFVKQLRDSTDRNSLSYYRKFVETLEFVLDSNRSDRMLCSRFLSIAQSIKGKDKAASKIERLEDGVLGEMTKFLILLRATGRHHLIHSLVTHSPYENTDQQRYDEHMILLLDAIISWLNWDVPPSGQRVERLGLWLSKHEGAEDEDYKLVKWASCFSGVRHGTKSASGDQVRELVSSFLDRLAASTTSSPSRIPATALVADEADAITEVVQRARVRECEMDLKHSVNSRMGSEASILGSYLMNEAAVQCVDNAEIGHIIEAYGTFGVDEPASHVIYDIERSCEGKGLSIKSSDPEAMVSLRMCLVDDHPLENCWGYASQLVHNGSAISCIQFEGRNEGQSFRGYIESLLRDSICRCDLLLLDLRMPAAKGMDPTVETGLLALEEIRRIDKLVPVVFLSAHREALVFRRGISVGASEFFPKESPKPLNCERLVEYSGRYISLPTSVGLSDGNDVLFLRCCRNALRDLNTEMQCLLDPAYDGKSPLIATVTLTMELQNWLGKRGAASVPELRTRVIGQVLWLFQRIVYFALMPTARYLGRWIEYFTSAVGDLQPSRIGLDQVWVDAGMIADFVLNVFALSNGLAETTPGERSVADNELLRQYIGDSAFFALMWLWNARNDRRYGARNDWTKESKRARTMAMRCIETLESLDLVRPLTYQKDAQESAFLRSLHDSLEQSSKRSAAAMGLRSVQDNLSKTHAAQANSNRADFKIAALRYEQQIDKLKTEIGRIDLDLLLSARHRTCSHLIDD